MPRVKASRIETKENTFQRFEVVSRNRKRRAQRGEFFVEGVRPLSAAREHGWKFRAIAFSGDAPLSKWASEFIEESSPEELFDLSRELMAELSDKEETSELLALVEIPSDSLGRIPVSEDSIVVVLDRPASPGNLGTSIRSCDAFGVSGVIVTGHAADVYHPQCVRGSMGALFTVPVVRLGGSQDVALYRDGLRERFPSLRLVGTSAKGTGGLYDYYMPGPKLVVFGNETFGLSDHYQELWDDLLSIPMSGHVSSLNVSCALTVTLSHLGRNAGL